MANPYIYYVVTVDGAALIAQATAANPIVYVAALSKATAAESDADLSTKPASWYDGKTGDIAAVSAVGNNARIVAVWGNSGSAQAAKSLAVTARLASQSDEEAVVVTAMSDPDSSVILPGADDIQGGVEVPFSIALNASGDVEVTPGAAASIADLARFVSLHRAGDPTQGDEQDILGVKHFLENVTVNGYLDVDGFVESGDGIRTDFISARSPGNIEIGNTVVPDTDGAFDLGSEEYNFRTAYTFNVNSNSGELMVCAYNHDNDTQLSFISLDSTTTDAPFILLETSDTDDNRASLYIRRANGRCEITAYSDAALGTSSDPFDEAYASTVYTGRLRSPGSSISVCSLEPYGTAPYIGTQGLPFDTIQSLTFKGAEYLPDGVLQSNVGKSNNRFKGVYADTLDGVLVHPTASNADPPVGSIVMLEVADNTSVNIDVGDQLQGIASRSLKFAVWDAGAGEWGNRGNALGSSLVFRALSGGSPSSTHKNYVLAIRVS